MSFWNRLSNFHKISRGVFCWKGIDNVFERFRAIEQNKMTAMPIYGKKPIKLSDFRDFVCSLFPKAILFDFYFTPL